MACVLGHKKEGIFYVREIRKKMDCQNKMLYFDPNLENKSGKKIQQHT